MLNQPFQLKHLVLITFSFEGAPVALHAQDEGVEVIAGVIFNKADTETRLEKTNSTPEDPDKKTERLATYGGLLDKRPVQEVLKMLEQIPDEEKNEWFVYCDLNWTFKWAERIAPLGIPGNYPTEKDREFEVDRDMMKTFVEQHYDLDRQQVIHFSTADEAKKFLEENNTDDRIWVLKGSGYGVSTKVPDTYDPDLARQQILSELEDNKKELDKFGFILEAMITDAVEVTPEKLYYNGNPVFTDINIEIKGIANDSGPMTECTGDIVFPTNVKAKINKLAFPSIVDKMAKQHRGIFIWDLSLYFDSKTGKVYPGEFCPNRFGYSCFYNELAQVGSVKQFLESVINGINPFDDARHPFGASLRIFNIPKETDKGWLLKSGQLIIDNELKSQIWPLYVRRSGNKIVNTKFGWDVAVVTGQGDSPKEAIDSAYDNSEKIVFPDLYQLPIESFLSKRYAESVLTRFEYLTQNGWL